jgi:hypothetical protein
VSGPGGVGPMGSSRLTRLLQEKAEALKKKRSTAEALLKQVEERASSMSTLGLAPPELTEGLARLRELAHRSDWEALESRAEAILASLSDTVPAAIEGRRQRTEESASRLTAAGVAVPDSIVKELSSLAHPEPGAAWADEVARLAAIERTLRELPLSHIRTARDRALAVAKWAELPPERFAEFEKTLPHPGENVEVELLVESIEGIRRRLRENLPEAQERRKRVRESAEALRALAVELSISIAEMDAALAAEGLVAPEDWPEAVGKIEQLLAGLTEQLRTRVVQAMTALLSAVGGLSEYGVDAGPAVRAIEDALARAQSAAPTALADLLNEARSGAEEPIVQVVAGLLDEVRPRIVNARRLGRDSSDVFQAMNRAREALRLKIYSEALAAAREAFDKVRRLTEDVDGVRDELAAIEEMLGRFKQAGFASTPFESSLAGVREQIDRGEVGPARDALREAVHRLGANAVGYFLDRWRALDRAAEFARSREFLPDSVAATLTQARGELDRGELDAAVEHLSAADVELRGAAAPYVARRVEEMQSAFGDVSDDGLTAATRRHLADADVTIRVKEDVVGGFESLRRAEREFSAVFAARASGLVEALEGEVRVLESMGGTGEDLQRQIDEVQQIFAMGDFVNASRASQEIRGRLRAQQVVRSDEALSHAKLALVELEAMGLDLAALRIELDFAQAAAREGRTLEAYRAGMRLEETAARHRAAAQSALARFARLDETLARLGTDGIDASSMAPKVAEARTAFQALEFGRSLQLIEEVEGKLAEEESRKVTDRRLGEIALLLEEGNRLGLSMEPFAARRSTLETERPTAPPAATGEGARLLEEELVGLVRPTLEENLKALERDLDIARGAGIQLRAVQPAVAEARRRLGLPVPTGAAALLDEARSALASTRGVVEQAERIGRRVREALAQAELLHVPVATLKGRAEEVERRLDGKEYPRVIELGAAVERDLLDAIHQHVSKALAGFQAAVAQLRRSGGETSVAENLLHQARAALEAGKAVEALQIAGRSEAEIERVDLQRRLAQGATSSAASAVAKAKEEGFVNAEAETTLAQAQAALDQADYPGVLESAFAVFEVLSRARDGFRHARDAIEVAEKQLGEAKTLGADVQEVAQHLHDAQEELRLGRYPAAVRLGRETVEMGRWSIERMFAASIGELRALLETGRREGVGDELAPLDSAVQEAEAAVRSGAWNRVRSLLAKAEAQSRKLVGTIVDRRFAEVELESRRLHGDNAAESARRAAVKAQLEHLKETRDLGEAVRRLRAETEGLAARRQEIAARTLAEFRDRLWVGERLGIDTTPMMQSFGEARVALDGGDASEAHRLLAAASDALVEAVRAPFARKRKEVVSEVAFAEGGLHVTVDPVKVRLKEVEALAGDGALVDAARRLLEAEEDLNRRKSLHRELTNLHYLLDAALSRAEQRGLDTTEPRSLLADSLRLRATDYAQALEKAREALRLLQKEGVVEGEDEGASGSVAWPFVRPPSERTP